MKSNHFEYITIALFILSLLITSFYWQNSLNFTINVCSAFVSAATMWLSDLEFPENKLKAVVTNLTVFGIYTIIVIFSTNIALERMF